ncbi:hypothetical protein J2853_005549 [Streptosporangium lutulentum]|uniref:Uncharacterized protein n=1 Tax=Streptosporangium lutulentum TaxID=1461250 RepID=A0ABT9QHW4_9ACTN|nr:hypothetical protein [Streptosporangium lutulentum]
MASAIGSGVAMTRGVVTIEARLPSATGTVGLKNRCDPAISGMTGPAGGGYRRTMSARLCWGMDH